MSESALRYTTRFPGLDPVERRPRRLMAPAEPGERCAVCQRRLPPGAHELCVRCDQDAWDALPLSAAARQEAAA